MAKLDLTSATADAASQVTAALGLMDAAGNAQKAADKAAKALPDANQAASEASAAKAILDAISKQEDSVIAAGLDPSVVFSDLLTEAANLTQSAKDRLLDAASTSA